MSTYTYLNNNDVVNKKLIFQKHVYSMKKTSQIILHNIPVPIDFLMDLEHERRNFIFFRYLGIIRDADIVIVTYRYNQNTQVSGVIVKVRHFYMNNKNEWHRFSVAHTVFGVSNILIK